MSPSAKNKSKKKEEVAPAEPVIAVWVPIIDADGNLSEDSQGAISGPSTSEEERDEFLPSSFAIPLLAYYATVGDPVAYFSQYNAVNERTLRLLNKGQVIAWAYNQDYDEYKGKIIRSGADGLEFSQTELKADVPPEQIQCGSIVEFSRNHLGFINLGSLRLAKPTVTEMPEERRKKIRSKFDEIAEGGLATKSCAEVSTWLCPYCQALNLSEIREEKETNNNNSNNNNNNNNSATTTTSGNSDEEEESKTRYVYVCQNAPCGAPRPNTAWAVKQKDDKNCTTYTLKNAGPEVWTISDIKKWQANTADHTTVEEIIHKAMSGYSTELGPYCAGCGKTRGKGTGCEHAFDAKVYPPLSFVEFYELKGELPKAKSRLSQLADLLKQWPPCACGLLAIPEAPLNVFRAVKTAQASVQARGAFERSKNAIRTNILTTRAKGGPLFASISTERADQAMLCHIVPLQAGGCKTSFKNIVWRLEMCPLCQNLDKLFTDWQG